MKKKTSRLLTAVLVMILTANTAYASTVTETDASEKLSTEAGTVEERTDEDTADGTLPLTDPEESPADGYTEQAGDSGTDLQETAPSQKDKEGPEGGQTADTEDVGNIASEEEETPGGTILQEDAGDTSEEVLEEALNVLDAPLMSKEETYAYIDECLMNYVPYVDMSSSPLTYDEVDRYLKEKGVLDNRYVSSARGYRIDFTMGGGEWTVKGLYNEKFNDSSYVARWKAFDEKCVRIAGMADPGWSDFEKVLFAYDYLCKTNTTILPSRSDGAYDAARDGTGAVLDGNSVCSGLSVAYQAILRELGVKAYIVTADDIAHAWCAVSIDGRLYHADLLEGAGGLGSRTRGDVNYSFFLRSGEWIESIYGPYCYSTEDGWFDETDDPARYNDRHEGSSSGDWGKETGAFGYYKGFWYNASSVRNWATQAGWARRYRYQNESLVFDGRAFDAWDTAYSGFAVHDGKAYTAKDGKLYMIDMDTGRTAEADIEGSKVLYTDVDGILYTDREELDLSRISAREDIKTGWQDAGGARYYYDEEGNLVTGWMSIDGKKYHFGSDGIMKTSWQTISGNKYYFGTDGIVRTGFQTIDGKKYYLGSDGIVRTLWQSINGKEYYFGTDGVMRTGWQTVSGKKYYFGTDGSVRTGWQTISSKRYYFGTDGIMKTSWQTIDKKKYYLGNDGVMRTLWQTINGKRYYFGTDGVMRAGWQTVDGKKYCFGTDGALNTGWKTINGKRYYLGTDGVIHTGWQTIEGSRYYLGTDGASRTGWQAISGKKYYFDSNGVMKTSWQDISGKRYCFGSSGAMYTLWQTINGKKYYFGTDGVMRKSWQTIDGGQYYFGTDGAMKTLWQTVNGKKYYLGNDGIMLTSWQTIDGDQYYFGSDGALKTLWQTIGGSRYYFGTDGTMRTGWQTIDGKKYCLGADGIMLAGWQTINGKTYYFDTNGAMKTGWPVIAGKKYCLGTDGARRTGWQTYNGFRYYMGDDGAIRTGFQTISGKTYYFYPATSGGHYAGTMATGWCTLSGNTYYFGTNGAMRTFWQTINGFRYYFGRDGIESLGLRTISGKQYYFWPKTSGTKYKGTLAKNCTVRLGTDAYTIDVAGIAKKK